MGHCFCGSRTYFDFEEEVCAILRLRIELDFIRRIVRRVFRNFDESPKQKEAYASMKTGVRKSPPHHHLMHLSVEHFAPSSSVDSLKYFQMEWQILLVMGIMNVTPSKSVSKNTVLC